ncbi:hypothetical protein [Micromonospora sp. ATA51]|uniref:hypothetical protein n=1 Tax=Micromonospora sp. ATA51 TaxID=2806098 RepID=UPI001A593E0C|nr:hypothetical protein [Micromonospora sp. ATA51]MBM0224872.1 hypothetical protein [Micromonospora sp. ATA51]
MSLYNLTPRPGFERYTVQVGWNPHRTYVATIVDFTWNPITAPDRQPDTIHLASRRFSTRPRCLRPSNPTPTYQPTCPPGSALIKPRTHCAAETHSPHPAPMGRQRWRTAPEYADERPR